MLHAKKLGMSQIYDEKGRVVPVTILLFEDKIEFEKGEKVRITSISKGKGFQGVVKRWGFKGGPKSHGGKGTTRSPGSIGSAFPQHVQKGKKMPGRMGGKKVSVKMQVAHVNLGQNIIMVDGPVPGPQGTSIEVRK